MNIRIILKLIMIKFIIYDLFFLLIFFIFMFICPFHYNFPILLIDLINILLYFKVLYDYSYILNHIICYKFIKIHL